VQFLDAGGNPLEGMTAGATWTKSGEGFWTQGTESDKDGWAVLFLYPGQVQYVRGFDMDNHRLVSEGFVEVNPTAGQVIDNLRITMVATAKVHGRLEMEGGGSFEGKRLALKLTYADGLERRENIRPDAAGAFVLDKVKPGVATVELETLPAELTGIIGAAMEIKPGEDKDLGGIALRKIKYYTVKGQLAGSPTFSNLEGFKIRVDLMAWEPMNPTDKDGRFVLPKVPAGKHRLIAYLPYNLRMDRGVGHVEIDVPDKDIEGVKLPLETLATVRMRIADPAGKPVEGVSAAAWWTVDHSGVFTEGTRSDKDGRATLYMYPDDLQYVGAHDWDNRYELKGDVKTTPKPGQVVDDLKIIMVPAAK